MIGEILWIISKDKIDSTCSNVHVSDFRFIYVMSGVVSMTQCFDNLVSS